MRVLWTDSVRLDEEWIQMYVEKFEKKQLGCMLSQEEHETERYMGIINILHVRSCYCM